MNELLLSSAKVKSMVLDFATANMEKEAEQTAPLPQCARAR